MANDVSHKRAEHPWVVLDFDGVIVDTRELKVALYQELLDAELSRSEILRIERPSEVLSPLGAREYCQRFRHRIADANRIIPDSFLLDFRAKGVRVGIFTKQPQSVINLVLSDDLFDQMVCEEQLGGQPKYFQTDRWFHGTKIFIGDTTEDVLAAKAANATSIFAEWGFEEVPTVEPDYFVKDLESLANQPTLVLEGFSLGL